MPPTEQIILWVHAASTFVMVGLIWFVQIVHYPLFRAVGAESFIAYEGEHQRRTTLIVGPTMLAEMITCVWLVALTPPDVSKQLATAGLVLLLVIWASTAFVQVPCHKRLSRGFKDTIASRLVWTNWIRTVAWSFRGVIVLAIGV